jgi:hypothetical protein
VLEDRGWSGPIKAHKKCCSWNRQRVMKALYQNFPEVRKTMMKLSENTICVPV